MGEKERVFSGSRELTSDEIMAKCPEQIDPAQALKPKRGRKPRHGTQKRLWHSEEDRIRAATVYATCGSAAETERITGIPAGTVRQWRSQDWWPQVIERVQAESDDLMDVKFTEIVSNTVEQINDRIANGNYLFNKRTGQLERIPAPLKDLGVTASIFMDKRDLVRRNKKTAVEQASTQEMLRTIASAVKNMAKKREGEIIDVTAIEEEGSMGRSQEYGGHPQVERADAPGELPSGNRREGIAEPSDSVHETEGFPSGDSSRS